MCTKYTIGGFMYIKEEDKKVLSYLKEENND